MTHKPTEMEQALREADLWAQSCKVKTRLIAYHAGRADHAEAEVKRLRGLIAEWAETCRAINESKSSFDINLMHRLANAEDALTAEGEAP